jgi:glucosyl-dolichyl phosphate glucuronosyltransferase
MNITLIVCTYNRCESLAATLDSIARSALPDSIEWEVLVVDNNSGDQTREIAEGFCRRYPTRFRYLFEAHPGKSYALNSGIRAARGDILAFTDDDVIVDPNWLRNLTARLHSIEWSGAAGRVLRSWTCPPPRWLSLERRYEKMGWALVSFDIGQEAGELSPAYPPVGANMAFRKDVFTRHGVFRTDLGPQGDDVDRPSGQNAALAAEANIRRRHIGIWEDTEFGQRLMNRGERLRYEPSAVVYHPVPERRLTKEYFLAWWFIRGRDSIRIMPTRGPVWGMPRRYVRMARMTILLLGRTLAWSLALKPHRRFYYKLLVWEMAGAIIGATTSGSRRADRHDNSAGTCEDVISAKIRKVRDSSSPAPQR